VPTPINYNTRNEGEDMHTKLFFLCSLFVLAFPFSSMGTNMLMPPARVIGTVTIDGDLLTQSDTGYTFEVTKADGTVYNPAAEDTDGVDSNNTYYLMIPITAINYGYGGSASPGDVAKIHVYKDGNELDVTTPIRGYITVGESGSLSQIDVMATSASTSVNPPSVRQVGFCDQGCQAEAPLKVSGTKLDVCFNYTGPVNILAGVLSDDFKHIWWLRPDCFLYSEYSQAVNFGSGLSCQGINMPVESGYLFWLVSPVDLSQLDWENGIYELLFYQVP